MCPQKGTCCEVFRGRGGWRLCSHQNGDGGKVTRNLLPGALTLGSFEALLFPATTGLLTSFNTFPWNCRFQLWPIRVRMRWQLRQRDYRGPISGPFVQWEQMERIFRRRASRQIVSRLEMSVRQQQKKWSRRVEPEKSADTSRDSRHVSNIT